MQKRNRLFTCQSALTYVTFYIFTYRKSSIKPPGGGGLFISSAFDGGLNRDGGGLFNFRNDNGISSP